VLSGKPTTFCASVLIVANRPYCAAPKGGYLTQGAARAPVVDDDGLLIVGCGGASGRLRSMMENAADIACIEVSASWEKVTVTTTKNETLQ
jgi:hypothetical protein